MEKLDSFSKRKCSLRESLLNEELRQEVIEHIKSRRKEQELKKDILSFKYLQNLASSLTGASNGKSASSHSKQSNKPCRISSVQSELVASETTEKKSEMLLTEP